MDDDLRSRLRGERTDYTQPLRRPARPLPPTKDLRPVHQQARPADPVASPVVTAPVQPVAQPKRPAKTHRRHLPRPKLGRKKLFLALFTLLVLAGGSTAWVLTHRDASPVPKNIQKAFSFPVYYPDSKKLPVGFNVDTTSFSHNGSVLFYTITYSGGQSRILVTVQAKPSDPSAIQNLDNQLSASHTTYSTPVGVATIGSQGKITVVNLPTNTNTWLIMTIPQPIDQDQLHQVLNAFKS